MKTKHRIRESFRSTVFKRDNHQCKICKCENALDAHHITDRHDMPNGGYVKENGITLCSKCHLKAEQHHIDGTWEPGFHPNDLYKLICSSHEQATAASII